MFYFFTRTTVQARLVIGFGIVVVMMILITIIGINSVSTIDNTMIIVTDTNSVKQRYAINLRGSVHDRSVAIRDVVLIKNDYDLQETLEDIERLSIFYNDSRVPLDKLMISASANEIRILNGIKNV
ncbi:MAG: MCP four helix bundle domain-containing protein [Psychrobium sp.]|nr:MCP four helix bundle domain-containing protein [Psychrobium sp.]